MRYANKTLERKIASGKFTELTAAELTKEALIKLRAKGITCWRQSNLTYRSRKGIVTPGVSDILGFDHEGRFVAAEVKKIGDKLSQEQIDFLTAVKEQGAIALIVTQENGQAGINEFEA